MQNVSKTMSESTGITAILYLYYITFDNWYPISQWSFPVVTDNLNVLVIYYPRSSLCVGRPEGNVSCPVTPGVPRLSPWDGTPKVPRGGSEGRSQWGSGFWQWPGFPCSDCRWVPGVLPGHLRESWDRRLGQRFLSDPSPDLCSSWPGKVSKRKGWSS